MPYSGQILSFYQHYPRDQTQYLTVFNLKNKQQLCLAITTKYLLKSCKMNTMGMKSHILNELDIEISVGLNHVFSSQGGGISLEFEHMFFKWTHYQHILFYIPDIDECATGTHECSQFAICTNNIGSYKCMCTPNFTGDGRACTGMYCILQKRANIDSNKIFNHCILSF